MGDNALIPLRMFRTPSGSGGDRRQRGRRRRHVRGHLRAPAVHADRARRLADASPGFLMFPLVVGMMSASIISGQVISRTGRIRPFPLIGSALICMSLLLLSRITADTHLVLVMLVMFALGYGLGNCMQPLLLILQSRRLAARYRCRHVVGDLLPPDRRHPRCRHLLVGALQHGRAQHQGPDRDRVASPAFQQAVASAAQSPDPFDRQVADAFVHPTPGGGVLAQVKNDSSIISQMPAALAHPFKAGFAESMDTVFLLAGCVGDPGVPGPAADAQGRAPGDLGECRRTLRGGALPHLSPTRSDRRQSAQRDTEITPSRHAPTRLSISQTGRWCHDGGRPRGSVSGREHRTGPSAGGSPLMDLNTLYHRTVECWADRVNAVTDDQWDAATPCRDWTVRGLVNHVVGEDLWTKPLVEGRTLAEVGDSLDGDLLGDAPVRRALDAAKEATTAVAEGLPRGGTVHLSYGEEQVGEYVHQLAADHLVHAWDLAAATGGDVRLDPHLVAEISSWYAEREHLYRGAGMVAPRSVSHGGAQSDLLAAFGRDAEWGSTTPPWRRSRPPSAAAT